MKRKRRFISLTVSILLFLFLFLPANLFAFTYSGWTNLYGSGGWTNPDDYTPLELWADLLFTVDLNESTGLWTYTYEIGVDNIELGIFINETSHEDFYGSSTFTNDNIKAGTTENYDGGLGTYSPTNSFPTLPSEIYGILWEQTLFEDDPSVGTYEYTYKYILVSDRSPMWGNVYIDGQGEYLDLGYTYAYNLGWSDPRVGIYANFDPENLPLSTSEGFEFALVPNSDTTPIPEPTTMLLFGAGLVGLAGFGRKKFKK